MLVVLAVVGACLTPVHAVSSTILSLEPIASFTGANLPAGTVKNYTLSLTQNYTALLFYAKELGPDDNNPNDAFDVSLIGQNYTWNPPCSSCLQGELWTKIQGPIPPGSYNVTVTANSGATGLISFKIAFYDVPSVPAVFSGKMWGSSLYTSPSIVMFKVLSSGNYTLEMNATAGDFGVTLNGAYLGAVYGPNSTAVQLSAGISELDISNDPLSRAPDHTQWILEILGSSFSSSGPALVVTVRPTCIGISTNNTECVLTAQASSVGANVTATYQWSSNGGSFNSTTGQTVVWVSPTIKQTEQFEVTCNATAPNYTAGSALIQVNASPVPEFVSTISLLPGILLAGSLIIFRTRKRLGST